MIRGVWYFMLILLALWVVQGFGSFLVDMWPLIKWGVLVAAFFIVIKQLSGKPKPTTTADTEGPAE